MPHFVVILTHDTASIDILPGHGLPPICDISESLTVQQAFNIWRF
jgi:hypothetical protein